MRNCDINLDTTRRRWLPAILCLPWPMYAALAAADQEIPAGVDLSRWACEYCVFEQGASGEVELGAGYVSEDSFKFGEYNGLKEEGYYLIGDATARYRDEDADYVDLRARNLGLDSRSLDIEGGRQGKYRLFLNYNEIPHYISDSVQTPYRGNGGTTLSLPPGWVTAGSTAGMTELAASLQGVDLKTQRKRLGLGLALIPAKHWETGVSFRHEVRDGQKASAGSFFFSTAQLVEPVDYVTDEVEASATYSTGKWQTRLAYYGSFFSNNDSALTWQNAYNPIVAGADAGQRALPPDNQFHQLQLSSAYRLGGHTRLSGDIAVGRMEQDEDLLAATVNPNLAVALPRTSADAKVDTLTANLKVNSAINRKLQLNAAWRYNDRDNKTPSEVFNWVTTDAFLAAPRRNLPYSFTDMSARLGADYRISRITRVSGGYDYTKKERTHQEVNDTTEDTFWAKVSVRARENLDLALKAAHADRSTSDYNPVAEIDPAQNPLLRKFNMADRERDTASVQASFIPHERVTIGLSLGYSQDEYTNSVLGLTKSRETDINADASLILTEATSLHVNAGRQLIKSRQVGSQTFSTPDWSAKNEDTYDSFGIGIRHQLIKDKLDVGADYVLSRSTGQVKVETGAPNAEFPDLRADLDSVKLYADYRLKDNLTLHAAYWYEHYNSKSWMLDGVDPATISSAISFGEDSPDYDVHAIMMSLRYRF
jgi:MtrB/PioB family decaheme-associated outer membrane protein